MKRENGNRNTGFLAAGFIFAVSLLVFISSSPVYAAAENVFVLIIDGLRNDEAFDDPTHQYIPHIWNDLRPNGTINTNFWNTGLTSTTAGHNQIVTGVRLMSVNEQSERSKIHSKYPNIFEYYRKQKNIPKDKVWFVAGKGDITGSVNYSLHPDYVNLGAFSESICRPDADTWASVQQKMDNHPSLMVINLRDVDYYGHKADYTVYTDAIKSADQIAYDLWQKIQNDPHYPHYKDKTDLIITTDHGRDSDGYWKGFVDHGRSNHGCRHLFFLAIGPDFKQNQVVNIRRDQIDIVPTIGAILGVQAPYADGEVMSELFNNIGLGSDVVTGGQRRLSLTASGSGLHAVWSRKNGEEWDIYYKKSQDGGNTWTEPVKLFENGQNNNYFYEAKITAQDDDLVYVTVIGYTLINQRENTYTWRVFGRRSLDGGNTWGNIQKLDGDTVLIAHPSITSRGNSILITYSSRNRLITKLRSLYSIDRGATFTIRYVTDMDNLARQNLVYSAVTSDQDTFYAVWTSARANQTYKYWNVFLDRLVADSSQSWGTDRAITLNTTNNMKFYMNNAITANSFGFMKLLITDREDTTDINDEIIAGRWQTLLNSSSDSGDTFAEESEFYDSNVYEAWNPKVSFTDLATEDFVVIWEQHFNSDGAEIYARKNMSGAWQDILPASQLDGKDSAEPDLAIYHGDAHAGWQDYEKGSWQIKVKKIN